MIHTFLPLVCLICQVVSDIPFFLTGNRQRLDLKSSIKQSSKNPCLNFYEYSCSTWKAEATKPDFETSWNHFTAASYEIKKKVQDILNEPLGNADSLLGKAQKFYNACINFERNQKQYFSNLKAIIDYFKGWPITDENWSVNRYNWLEEIANITRTLGFHPMLKFHVGIDYKKNDNYTLYIEPGNLIFPQTILLNPAKFYMELTAYTEWISKTIRHLYPTTNILKKRQLNVLEIVEFEMQLAKLMSVKLKMERNTVKNFSRRFNVNFSRIFNILYFHLGITVYPEDTLIIRNYGYFKNLVIFLNTVNTKKIANYLIWSIVKEFSRDTTTYLKNVNFSIDRSVVGLTSDISKGVECTNKAIDHFSFAILPKYLELYFSKNVLENVHGIVADVKSEYVNLLNDNTWLSNRTKLLAVKKIENIGCVIGYSKWMKNETLIGQYYKKLNITDDHLINVIMAKQFKIQNNLKLLRKPVDSEVWPSNVFDVNAYYSVLQNSVFIPLGILQVPFYDENRPSIFNYGALGSLIGHELSHSLDTTGPPISPVTFAPLNHFGAHWGVTTQGTKMKYLHTRSMLPNAKRLKSIGRQANIIGIIKKWWPAQDIAGYQLKTKCFEQLYKDKNTKNILLVGENIADNVGLSISFKAYKKLKNVELDGIFWGMENDYVFFLTYAQMWCEISDQLELFNDEHTSVEVRVNQAVRNNLQFNTVFDCTKNTSNIEVCKLW